jgi:hypothetical protein
MVSKVLILINLIRHHIICFKNFRPKCKVMCCVSSVLHWVFNLSNFILIHSVVLHYIEYERSITVTTSLKFVTNATCFGSRDIFVILINICKLQNLTNQQRILQVYFFFCFNYCKVMNEMVRWTETCSTDDNIKELYLTVIFHLYSIFVFQVAPVINCCFILNLSHQFKVPSNTASSAFLKIISNVSKHFFNSQILGLLNWFISNFIYLHAFSWTEDANCNIGTLTGH